MKPRSLDTVAERRKEKKDFATYFGKYLRKVREEKNISQENLSLKAGYYRTYVGKIEQGLYSPSFHTVWRLANALGVSLSDLLRSF